MAEVRTATCNLLTEGRLVLDESSTDKGKWKEEAALTRKIAMSGRKHPSLPHLSLSKPSWVVRTESNVRKETRKKPNPPCVICHGTGRVECHHCSGQGRTNCVQLAMLPKGEWPTWCRTCGGSGLGYCSRCLGTGEYRYIMGFRFMNTNSDDTKHQQGNRSSGNPAPHIAADPHLNGDQPNPNHST